MAWGGAWCVLACLRAAREVMGMYVRYVVGRQETCNSPIRVEYLLLCSRGEERSEDSGVTSGVIAVAGSHSIYQGV